MELKGKKSKKNFKEKFERILERPVKPKLLKSGHFFHRKSKSMNSESKVAEYFQVGSISPCNSENSSIKNFKRESAKFETFSKVKTSNKTKTENRSPSSSDDILLDMPPEIKSLEEITPPHEKKSPNFSTQAPQLRVTFVGIFDFKSKILLASYSPPGSQRLKFLVRDLLTKSNIKLENLKSYKGLFSDSLSCQFYVDNKDFIYAAMTAGDYNAGAAAALLEEIRLAFQCFVIEKNKKSASLQVNMFREIQALELKPVWEKYENIENLAKKSPRLSIKLVSAEAAAGPPEMIEFLDDYNLESVRTLITLDQSLAEASNTANQDAPEKIAFQLKVALIALGSFVLGIFFTIFAFLMFGAIK